MNTGIPSALVGINKVIRGPQKLKYLYSKLLRLTEKLPKDSPYRIHTEAIACHRLSILNETEDTEEIEMFICGGRIEMLIEQAIAEIDLCGKMISWKLWEPLIQKPPPNQWKWPCGQ